VWWAPVPSSCTLGGVGTCRAPLGVGSGRAEGRRWRREADPTSGLIDPGHGAVRPGMAEHERCMLPYAGLAVNPRRVLYIALRWARYRPATGPVCRPTLGSL